MLLVRRSALVSGLPPQEVPVDMSSEHDFACHVCQTGIVLSRSRVLERRCTRVAVIPIRHLSGLSTVDCSAVLQIVFCVFWTRMTSV